MIIIIILAVLTVVFAVMHKHEVTDFDLLWLMLSTTVGIILLLVVVVWPITYFSNEILIEKTEFLRESLKEEASIRDAGMRLKVTERNEWIIGAKRWGKLYFFDLFYPKSIQDLELIHEP